MMIENKILCEDLSIVDISVGTVYVSLIFLLAVCNPWGWGRGHYLYLYEQKALYFKRSAANQLCSTSVLSLLFSVPFSKYGLYSSC